MSASLLTLSGRYIDLEPLCKHHHNGLCRVVSDTLLWHNDQTFIPTAELIPTYIKLSEAAAKKGEELPFAIISKNSHEVVGSIKLQCISPTSAEIGSTFIAIEHQKTVVNTEAKFILMQHAFECLNLEHINCIIHKENKASLKAIERLGITQRKSLFHDKDMPQWESYDYYRYVISSNEWSFIKENIEKKLFS